MSTSVKSTIASCDTSGMLARQKSLDVNGITLRYIDEGEGQTILFFHNGGACQAIWTEQILALRGEYRVVAVDFPGFGESDKPRRFPHSGKPFRYDLPMAAGVVDVFAKSLRLDRPVLVGNCMGSAAALTYALNFPHEVGGLFLCNLLTESTIACGELRTLYRLSRIVPGMKHYLAMQFEIGRIPARFRRWSMAMQVGPEQRLPEKLQHTLENLYLNPSQLRVFNDMTAHMATFRKLNAVTKPTHFPPTWVVWGEHNRVLPVDAGRAFAERFGVDRCEVIPHVGHLPMAEQPEVFTGLLREFLQTHERPAVSIKPKETPFGINPIATLQEMAESFPHKSAVIEAASEKRSERKIDWSTLWRMSNRAAWELSEAGVVRGDRVLVLVTPGPEFLAISQALYMLGASSVFIDGGMKLASMAQCIKQCRPTVMIGIPRAHALRLMMPRAMGTVRRYFSLASAPVLRSTKILGDEGFRLDVPFPKEMPDANALAAIVFTSGSTGPAKGVELSFKNFSAMMTRSAEMLKHDCGETAIVLYPLFLQIFALMGRTSILPDMDFSRPALADPKYIVDCIRRYAATTGFGSPAILIPVGDYCQKHGITLEHMRLLLIAGAPIAYRQAVEPLARAMPNGRLLTPYGATEALPVAIIDSDEIRHETAALTAKGAGTCIGKPIDELRVRIIPIVDAEIRSIDEAGDLAEGEVGEICVAGDNVTERYFDRPDLTRPAKISDASVPGGSWHRMGDVGYFDAKGRLWYCGRKKHRVACLDKTYFAQQAEGVADAIEGVFRSAFVGVTRNGDVLPVLVIEPERSVEGRFVKGSSVDEQSSNASRDDWEPFATMLSNKLKECGFPVEVWRVLRHDGSFPVDPRHNSKINREQLALWAANRLGLAVDQTQRSRSVSSADQIKDGWG